MFPWRAVGEGHGIVRGVYLINLSCQLADAQAGQAHDGVRKAREYFSRVIKVFLTNFSIFFTILSSSDSRRPKARVAIFE